MPDYSQLLKATDLRLTICADGYRFISGKLASGIKTSWPVTCFWVGCGCRACASWWDFVQGRWYDYKGIGDYPYYGESILDSEYIEKPVEPSYSDSCDGWRDWYNRRIGYETEKQEKIWREMRGNY